MTIATDEELREAYGMFASDVAPAELRRVYDLGYRHGRAMTTLTPEVIEKAEHAYNLTLGASPTFALRRILLAVGFTEPDP